MEDEDKMSVSKTFITANVDPYYKDTILAAIKNQLQRLEKEKKSAPADISIFFILKINEEIHNLKEILLHLS